MIKTTPRIVFMGTPEFAVAPLKALQEAGAEIAAVVTAPDKPAGRGKKLKSPAVKEFALKALDCPVLQPEKLKNQEFTEQLKSFDADLFIVVAFRMLPEMVWSIPKKGTVNLHASLLPQYRGAAPINWCLINGEKETGVTTFLIDHEIDTGRILLQEKIDVGPDEDAGSLHDRLMTAGSDLIIRTVDQLMKGTIEAIDQRTFDIPEEQLKKAPRIYRDDCRIDWQRSSKHIHNFVRGLSPYPAAFTFLHCDKKEALQLRLSGTKRVLDPVRVKPGTIASDGKSYLKVACADGWLEIASLQPAGRKRMSGGEFIRGYKGNIEQCHME
jgi:methionyl-tRNA formyltransferase